MVSWFLFFMTYSITHPDFLDNPSLSFSATPPLPLSFPPLSDIFMFQNNLRFPFLFKKIVFLLLFPPFPIRVFRVFLESVPPPQKTSCSVVCHSPPFFPSSPIFESIITSNLHSSHLSSFHINLYIISTTTKLTKSIFLIFKTLKVMTHWEPLL